MFKKLQKGRKYSTKLLTPKGTVKWVYHLAGNPPGCWLLGRRQKVLRLCLKFFFSDLNSQPESVFVPFVKTPLFFLFTGVVSLPLFKISKVRAALSGWKQDLVTALVARSQAHLWCLADRGNQAANQLWLHCKVTTHKGAYVTSYSVPGPQHTAW